MKKVKITVLKTTLDKELAAEYGVEGLTACPMMREGQVFYADYAKPDGLCDEAWKAIYQYVFALAHGAGDGLFYYGDWIRKPGVAICSCNDGLRPVIFKLEATGRGGGRSTIPPFADGRQGKPAGHAGDDHAARPAVSVFCQNPFVSRQGLCYNSGRAVFTAKQTTVRREMCGQQGDE